MPTADQDFIYQRTGAARLFAGLWLLVAAIILSQLIQQDSPGGHVLSAVLLAASLLGMARAWRMNTIMATRDGLKVRRFNRTWRLPWTEVRGVAAVEHVNGFRGAGLTIQVTDASGPRKLREFFRRSPEGAAKVRAVAQELDRRRREAGADAV